MIEVIARTPEVPYGDYFKTTNRYCITHVAENRSRLVLNSWVDFSKSTIFRSRIEKGSVDGVTGWARDLTAALHAAIGVRPAQTPQPAGAGRGPGSPLKGLQEPETGPKSRRISMAYIQSFLAVDAKNRFLAGAIAVAFIALIIMSLLNMAAVRQIQTSGTVLPDEKFGFEREQARVIESILTILLETSRSLESTSREFRELIRELKQNARQHRRPDPS